MYNICFMCFKDAKDLQSLHLNGAEEFTVKQISYVLPEIVLEPKIPAYICSTCTAKLRSFCEFKKLCIENYCRLKHFIKISEGSNNEKNQVENTLQIELNNIKQEQEQEQRVTDDLIRELQKEQKQQTQFINVEDNIDIKEDKDFEDSDEHNLYQEILPDIKKESGSEQDFYSQVSENGETDQENSVNAVLPEKSKPKYIKEYQNFCDWCSRNNMTDVTENVVLAYYKTMSETKKASTLWASFSMIRTCLSIYKDIDVTKYLKVTSFLKSNSRNYQPKKSKMLDSEDIIKFINDADNDTFLAMKVILIMGYCGACRRVELTNMNMNDVEIKSDIIKVNVPKTKTNISRMFAITESSWIALIKSYVQMRPAHTSHSRFFLTFRSGRCTTSPIGINKMGVVPKCIAKYLKLPNPELYTGHCFRRSSTSHLANQGSDMLTIKKHGGWQSSSASEGYIIVKKTS